MEHSLDRIIFEIHAKEDKILSENKSIIDEANEMTLYLQDLLFSVKEQIVENGFKNDNEEINFFRAIKPKILGKLIYYNKIFRIETACPVSNGKMYYSYYSMQLANLKKEYMEHICNSDFYRYYRSGRTDRDHIYFKRGHINYHDGLNSIVFEMDPEFSTFYVFAQQSLAEAKAPILIVRDLYFKTSDHTIDAVTDCNGYPEFWTVGQPDAHTQSFRITWYHEDQLYSEIYLLKDGRLVYVLEEVKRMRLNHYTQSVWRCEYFIKDDKVIDYTSLGHGK